MARKRTVQIGADAFTAVCPVPRDGIGFWEGCALSVRGWIDARVTRVVPDSAPTHTVHRLQAVHRRHEAEVVRRIDEVISAVDRELAPMRVLTSAATVQVSAAPTSSDLAGRPVAARSAWASEVRAAHASRARSAAVEDRRSQATSRVAVLEAVREGVLAEGEGVRRQWREAYRMRAARYTRARFARRGAAMVADPSLPPYPYSEDPARLRERAA